MRKLILLLAISSVILGDPETRKFPDNLLFGAATASYQTEGGWDEDGKGESIWDHFIHENPDRIANQNNGDVACDSYHKYLEDIQMLKTLGANHYRFSISWPRILPSGTIDNVNQAGVEYYKKIIAALKENNIIPFVTIYHWDLPQALQEIGGWTNESIIDYYADYARLLFSLYGDDVKNWMTFNEPLIVCQFGYGNGLFAPGIEGDGTQDYICAHNVIKSHANAYHIYDEEFRATQNGRISIVINTDWYEPGTDSNQDQESAERRLQFTAGWYANAIYHPDGNYPQVMIDRIAERSKQQGLEHSRLPEFTVGEIEYIKGTFDFFSLNHYITTRTRWREDYPIDNVGWEADISVITYQDGNYFVGLRSLLNWVDKTYNHPEIVISENGYGDGKNLNDQGRIQYLQDFLSSALQAILDDGVNLTAYTAWSLMDVFEWTGGYTISYGFYQVDFNDPNRTRTPKSSVQYYNKIINTRCLVDTCQDNL